MADQLKPEVLALKGSQHFIVAGNERNGDSVAIAVYQTARDAKATSNKIQEIWGRLAEDLASPPEAAGFDVMHCESNA